MCRMHPYTPRMPWEHRREWGILFLMRTTKSIGDSLGLPPEWISIQRLAADHVGLHFLPPDHRESLKGCLAPYIEAEIPSGDAWQEARERGWVDAARRWVP